MSRGRGGQRGIAVRYGHCVAHVESVDQAAHLILKLNSAADDFGSSAAVLQPFEKALRAAGQSFQLGRKASSEEVRLALAAVEPDLAKRWVGRRAGRRYMAHPGPMF